MPNMRPGIRPAGYAPSRPRDGTRMSMGAKDVVIPRRLFLRGEIGAWYEPRDNMTLYQDATSAAPVSDFELPSGLVLDKSQNLALGQQLISNGDFSGGTTGWSSRPGGSIAVVNGELVVTISTANQVAGGATQQLSLTIGAWYVVRARIRKGTGDSVNIAIINAAFSAFIATGATITSTSGTEVVLVFQATETNSSLYLRVSRTAGPTSYTGIFDNVSVTSLAGSHAAQSTLTARPTLKALPTRLFFDADPDSLTIGFASSPGVSTVAYGVAGGNPVINTDVNISGTTYTLNPTNTGSNLTGLVIVNRALTSAETVKLTAYLRRLS